MQDNLEKSLKIAKFLLGIEDNEKDVLNVVSTGSTIQLVFDDDVKLKDNFYKNVFGLPMSKSKHLGWQTDIRLQKLEIKEDVAFLHTNKGLVNLHIDDIDIVCTCLEDEVIFYLKIFNCEIEPHGYIARMEIDGYTNDEFIHKLFDDYLKDDSSIFIIKDDEEFEYKLKDVENNYGILTLNFTNGESYELKHIKILAVNEFTADLKCRVLLRKGDEAIQIVAKLD